MSHTRETVAELGARGLLRAVLNTSNDATLVVDSFGRVLLLNRSAEQLLRCSLVEGDQRPWTSDLGFELRDPSRAEWTREELLISALRGESVEGKPLLLDRSGDPPTLEITVSAWPVRLPSGQVHGAVFRFRPTMAESRETVAGRSDGSGLEEASAFLSPELRTRLGAACMLARQVVSPNLDREFREDSALDLQSLLQEMSDDTNDVIWMMERTRKAVPLRVSSGNAFELLEAVCARAYRALQANSQYAAWSSEPLDLVLEADLPLIKRAMEALLADVVRDAPAATRIDLRAIGHDERVQLILRYECAPGTEEPSRDGRRAARFARAVAQAHGGAFTWERLSPRVDAVTLTIPSAKAGERGGS